MCQPLKRVPPGGGIELQKHTYMRDQSAAMTKKKNKKMKTSGFVIVMTSLWCIVLMNSST